MDAPALPNDWAAQREMLRRITTHVVAHAQQRVTGHFALTALPGGYGTPQFGDDRRRVRLSGSSLLIENARGDRDGTTTATTHVVAIDGATIRSLCTACGFEPDPDLSVGEDTPPLGDADEAIGLDDAAIPLLGWWYDLGQRAMDAAIVGADDPRPSIIRLWPEHFDLGVDVAVDHADKPGVRTNLGAAAGDGFHERPYLYVGPWDGNRPGPADYWNAPFGAVLGYDEVAAADDPLTAATEFIATGLAHLRG